MTKKLNELFEIELTTKEYKQLLAIAAAIVTTLFTLTSFL